MLHFNIAADIGSVKGRALVDEAGPAVLPSDSFSKVQANHVPPHAVTEFTEVAFRVLKPRGVANISSFRMDLEDIAENMRKAGFTDVHVSNVKSRATNYNGWNLPGLPTVQGTKPGG